MPTTNGNNLIMFTTYFAPRDYPESIVVRRWVIENGLEIPDEKPCIITPANLHMAHGVNWFLAEWCGLYPLGAAPQDDPMVVGSWI